MTSYTKKLFEVAPNEAQRIHRQEYRDYRYGKHVTLPLAALGLSPASRPDVSFGKRAFPPVLPAYECWAPEVTDNNHSVYPKVVVRAANSFEARRQYAAHYNLPVVEIASRRMTNPEGWQEVDGVVLPPITWADPV